MVIFHSFLYVYQRVQYHYFPGPFFMAMLNYQRISHEELMTISWKGTHRKWAVTWDKKLKGTCWIGTVVLVTKISGICWSRPKSIAPICPKNLAVCHGENDESDAMAPTKIRVFPMGFPHNVMGQWRTVWSLPRPRGAPRLSGRWPRTPIRSAAFWWSCPWRIWRISQAENRMISSLTPQFLGQFSLGKIWKMMNNEVRELGICWIYIPSLRSQRN